jgi:AbrB family looped-hinge helix DNA binding protein
MRQTYYSKMVDYKSYYKVRCAKMKAYRTVVSSKGQVVIPSELRAQFGLDRGTPATWSEEGGRLVLTPMTERQLDQIMGFLKPKPGEVSMFEESFAERERERRREK